MGHREFRELSRWTGLRAGVIIVCKIKSRSFGIDNLFYQVGLDTYLGDYGCQLKRLVVLNRFGRRKIHDHITID